MNQTNTASPPSERAALFMALFLAMGAALLLLLSWVLTIFGLVTLSGLKFNEQPGIFILAGGTFELGLLMLPGIILNARKFLHKPDWHSSFPDINDRVLIPIMIFFWLCSLGFGQFVAGNHLAATLILPFINILAIGLPILAYIRISLRGLALLDARRAWSIFGASLIISPLLALLFEVITVGIIILLYVAYASSIPGLRETFSSLLGSLQSGGFNESETLRMTASLLFAPGASLTALGIFSGAVPLIEETFKITMIMIFIKKIPHPTNGFMLGILCGAAFALSENIGYASAGSTNWAANAAARATSALPHILNSGMLGWGLVSAYREHRYSRLIASFLAATLIHGTWNAISVGLLMNSFSSYIAVVPYYLQSPYPLTIGWVIMALGVLIGLIFNNRQMRNSAIKNQAE